VDSSTANTGNAGSVNIDATESVVIDGRAAGSINPSLIISSANLLDDVLKIRYDLPDSPTGDSGDLTITAPTLMVLMGLKSPSEMMAQAVVEHCEPIPTAFVLQRVLA